MLLLIIKHINNSFLLKKQIIKQVQSKITYLLTIIFVCSFAVGYTPVVGVSLDELEVVNNDVSQGQLSMSEDGFLMKSNSSILDGISYLETGFNYIVKHGDTLSSVANDFSISVDTLKYCNPALETNKLSPDMEIFVPPVDGMVHIIQKDENVDKLAIDYNISKDSVLLYNDDTVFKKEGDMIFLPNAKPKPPVIAKVDPVKYNVNKKKTVVKNNKKVSNTSNNKVSVSTNVVASGESIGMPTSGTVTQRYRKGHYAIDIAKRGGANVVSAKGGVVKEVSVGGWNYGYGNYIIVDHGGGMTTLYAHLAKVYVSPGQHVGKGTSIGYMGNTGRSSGTHLHFEVIVNGRKQNPFAYIR